MSSACRYAQDGLPGSSPPPDVQGSRESIHLLRPHTAAGSLAPASRIGVSRNNPCKLPAQTRCGDASTPPRLECIQDDAQWDSWNGSTRSTCPHSEWTRSPRVFLVETLPCPMLRGGEKAISMEGGLMQLYRAFLRLAPGIRYAPMVGRNGCVRPRHAAGRPCHHGSSSWGAQQHGP